MKSNAVNKIILVTTLVLFMTILLKIISIVLTQALSFDGAFNTQVAINLVSGKGYSTSYNSIKLHDPIVQTGPTVILPTALAFQIFGVSFESALLVNGIYLTILFLSVIYYLQNKINLKVPYVLVAMILLFATPKLTEFGLGGYGEIPALTFFIISLIFYHDWHKKHRIFYLIMSGLFGGLSVLTKTVLLIMIPSFLFANFYFTILEKIKLINWIKTALIWIITFITPIALFEFYKLISLGWQSYSDLASNLLVNIGQQAGVIPGYIDTPGLLQKFSLHLTWLSLYIGIQKNVIILVLLSIFVALITLLLKNKKYKSINNFHTPDLLILFLVLLSYFGWFLIITPTWKAWHRRIFNGTVLVAIVIPIVIYLFIKLIETFFANKRKFYWINTIIILFLIIGSLIHLYNSKNFIISFIDNTEKKSALETGAYIRDQLQDANLLGYGWWQAPVISFCSGKQFYDFSKIKSELAGEKLNNYYFVADKWINQYEGGVEEALSKTIFIKIFSNNENDIYKVIEIEP